VVVREGEGVAVGIGEPGDAGGVVGRGPDAVCGLIEEVVAKQLDAAGGEVGDGGVDVRHLPARRVKGSGVKSPARTMRSMVPLASKTSAEPSSEMKRRPRVSA
jgi:hypothetical protein